MAVQENRVTVRVRRLSGLEDNTEDRETSGSEKKQRSHEGDGSAKEERRVQKEARSRADKEGIARNVLPAVRRDFR